MLPVSGNPIYYVEDLLGTSRVMTTNTGVVCYDADFYPYGGERTPHTNTCTQNNYKFEGKERDTETGNDDSGQQTKVAYAYDSYDNITQVSEYDYGLGLTRQMQTTFQTASAYLNQHIYNRPTQANTLDGCSTVIARTDYSYDAGTLTSITGATNHDDANYGSGFPTRGNLTSVTRYTNAAAGTGAISRAFTFDIFGNVLTAQVDCCQQQQFSFSGTTQYA